MKNDNVILKDDTDSCITSFLKINNIFKSFDKVEVLKDRAEAGNLPVFAV